MFPQALPEYIRKICAGKVWSDATFADMVDVILNDEYPRRPERTPTPETEVDPEDQLCTLKALLPDADPTFLQEKLEQLGGDQEALRHFIEDAVDNKTYPTMKEYLRKQQLSAQQRQYTTEFDVERFVELFPDPVAVFEDPHRKNTILSQADKYYVKWLMRFKYYQLYVKDINAVLETQGSINVISIVKALDKCMTKACVKKNKMSSSSRPDCQNIPLLQELAYFEHKRDILKHIEVKKKQAAEDRENAKHMGLLQSCSCCFDDEVMPCDILTCTGGCRFCRECIRRSTEVGFSEGKVNFPCFSDGCDEEFSLQVLQSVLPPKLFSKLAQKKAVAEVKAAGVEDLETCPFCDFANIPAPEDKLFRCLNPDCMKESCRLCKEPSHVPLRCEEVEKDEAIKARTYIENKMTEALIRECWKCGAKFIKEEGCNKMTCSCGAMMCYICRQPVKDYKHFNGQGGDRHDLCPLYTDNFSVNEKNVLKAAAEAKKEIDPAQLKNDPTADLQTHFADKIKEAENKAQQQAQARALHAQQHALILNAQQARIDRVVEMQRNMARVRQVRARDEGDRPRHRHHAAFHVHVQRGHHQPHVQVYNQRVELNPALDEADRFLNQALERIHAEANQAIEQ